MKIFSDNTRYSYVKSLFLIHSLWLIFITLKYYVQEAALKKMNDSISDINESMIKTIMEELRREVNTVQEVVEVNDSKVNFDAIKEKKDQSFISQQQTQQIKDIHSRTHPSKENIHRNLSSLKIHGKNKDVKEKSGVDKIEIPSSHNKYSSNYHKRNLNQIDLDMNIENEKSNTKTSCLLLDEIDKTSYLHNFYDMAFDFRMNIKTDGKPDQSWTLTPQHGKNNNEISIDSKSHISTTPNNIKPHTLHSFDYKCFVYADETTQKEDIEPICYDFEIYSEFQFTTEYCCELGIDHFTVSVNNSTVLSDRLYGRSLTASFCLNDDGKLINEETEVITPVERFPSRECIGEKCICDSNPTIVNFHEAEDRVHNIKMNTLTKMMFLSGSEKLRDIETPQYKAACWVLNDDPFFHQHQSEPTSLSSKQSENRMLQRYILALFYFATSPEQWNNHYHFLSSRSECQWNSRDEFYNGTLDTMRGILCDADENVFSINFSSNNLGGTIINELFGLQNLEQLILGYNEEIYGTVPSSLGTLPELRDLAIKDNSIEGTIPLQLFNATKIQRLVLRKIKLTGVIPASIVRLGLLSLLELSWGGALTDTLPEEIFLLHNLHHVNLYINQLSGTISPLISNWKKLEYLALDENNFSGTLPSTLRDMSRLKYAYLEDNSLTGNVPDFSMLRNLETMWLHLNNLSDDVSDQCDSMFKEGTYNETYGGFDILGITADCRNDVFEAKVSCSCCTYCTNDSPTWNGECGDTLLTIEIDSQTREEYSVPMHGAIWSLEDDSTGQAVFSAGPFSVWTANIFTFKACIAKSVGCYSVKTTVPSKEDRNFTIYLDNDPIYNGTFLGYENNDDIHPDTTRTVVSFQYDTENDEMRFDDDLLCSDIKMVCGEDEIIMKQNTTHRILYDSAIKISGSEKFQEVTSDHHKSLCWLFKHESYGEEKDDDFFIVKFTQLYVLTLLHLHSKDGLFGVEEYPPRSHECTWLGVSCEDSTQIVTGLSLGDNQTIGGTLVKEPGSLAYLEKLILSGSDINGTIPLEYSNLWRLVEFDLSRNNLKGTIPETFFRQLDKLEYIDFSDNKLSQSIPLDIGSFSPIHTLLLGKNELTGTLPLDGFKHHKLENLNVSENVLGDIKFPSLVLQTNLKTLDISSNIFVGTLLENIFELLSQLEHFNISQNEFAGVVPSEFPIKSNITHFDIHANRFRGTIPIGIAELLQIQHLNMQGNKLTGIIPSKLNQLSELNTLVLSHNELKSSIPLDFNKLPNLRRLYLHANELSGEAPRSTTKMDKYITDCGVPSEALDPVKCPSCNICCNSDDECNSQIIYSVMKPVAFALSFIFSLLGLMAIIYCSRNMFTENKYLKEYFDVVMLWNPSTLIGEKSVYHFLLIPNIKGWIIGVWCAAIQMATLFLFVVAADTTSEETDMEYSMVCPKNSLECEDTKSRTSFGYLVFTLLLIAWLMKDISGAFKLFLLSMRQSKIDFFFASSIIIIVTLFSASTSIYYNLAIATKDTDIITNAVILLFVNEIDERLYQLAETCDVEWVRDVNESSERGSYYDRKNLVIYRSLHKVQKRLGSVLQKIKKNQEAEDNEEIEVVLNHDDKNDISMENRTGDIIS